jgi:hypothetical protein
MPGWEYCQLLWKAGPISEAEKRELECQGLDHLIAYDEGVAAFGFMTILGSPDDPKQIASLGDCMASLGRNGWELVSHSQVTTGATYQVFYFKREAGPC